jgi:oligosaccharide repeat unit polymerase
MRSGIKQALTRIPRPLPVHLVAPFVLALLPLVLWLSIPEEGTLRGTPVRWILPVPDPVAFDINPLYLASLGLIGLLAMIMLTVEASQTPFSLHLVHWIFVYIFFFATPIVQYKIGVFAWKELTSLEVHTLLLTNLAILLWCVVWISSRVVQQAVLRRGPVPVGPRVYSLGVWISLGLALLATAYLILTLGPTGLLIRVSSQAYLSGEQVSTAELNFDRVLRGFPVAATVGAIWFLRRRLAPLWISVGLVAASLGLLLIANFPSGSARYLVGSVYLGLLLIVFSRYLRTGWPVVFLLVGGVLVLFPLLSTLRYASNLEQVATYLSGFNFLGPSLATEDFDAYSMVGYTIEYIHNGPGVTYGWQLLGVLFFFIPRSLWPDKPVGSGHTVALDAGLAFENVTSSPIAEGLINFGWVGVILFAFLLCWLFGALDAGFERAQRKESDALIRLVYPFWIGLAFFFLRGDLLSSTAFVVGFSVAFLPLLIRLPRVRLRRSKPRDVSNGVGV